MGTLYVIDDEQIFREDIKDKIVEFDVTDFTWCTSNGACLVVTSIEYGKFHIPMYKLGKTLFPTHEEAEAAL